MYDNEEALKDKVDDLMPFQVGDIIVESPNFAVEVIDTWEEQVFDGEEEAHVAFVTDGEDFKNEWHTASAQLDLKPGVNGNSALIRDGELVIEGRTAEGESFGQSYLD